MTAASVLVRSRTAWTALATVVVSIVGPRLGLTTGEVTALVAALQGIIATLYVQDTRRGKR